MPWYKIYADHGPGHQSHTTKYIWQDGRLSKDEKEEIFESFFEDYEFPIGYVKPCRLPENIRQQKIEECHNQIRSAKAILEWLK